MEWTVRCFQHHSDRWRKRKEEGTSDGHKMYAARQEAMWRQFAIAAKDSFSMIKVELNS